MDGHREGQGGTDRDRQADSCTLPETFVLRGYNDISEPPKIFQGLKSLNSLKENETSAMSKLKAFADADFKVVQIVQFQEFSAFPTSSRALFPRVIKIRIVWQKVTLSQTNPGFYMSGVQVF